MIDFRALEALGCNSADGTVSFCLANLDTCGELATAQGVTLRDLDRTLWQWSDERSALQKSISRHRWPATDAELALW